MSDKILRSCRYHPHMSPQPRRNLPVDLSCIRDGVIGDRVRIATPFGERPLVYADYTASGRSWAPIEAFLRERVLPFYANTHSESSLTGRQTGRLREEARRTIREALQAGPEHAVIFCGSGATAAVNRLVDVLGLRRPASGADPFAARPDARPVVLVGPYEHHSNELPWRESVAELRSVPLDADGALDLGALEAMLEEAAGRPVLASFSAASNVTGVKTDTRRVGALVHRHGGRVFWDYAAAAPYVGIDASDKDALFLSPHKFLGGPGTPGILVVRRDLLSNAVPAVPGGGTVSFVGPDFHRYLDEPERREEGGTPAIVESIRAGLVFRLQQAVGTERIEAREAELVQRALHRFTAHPKLRVLGNPALPRLSIVSLQVLHEGEPLHYGFVVTLLNDLFGIQARGGCSCAGPYGHALLGIDRETSRRLDAEVARGNVVLRPGWVRLNFNYFLDDETVEYLIRALELIAEHGWKLLPRYRFDRASGTWVHRDARPSVPASLDDFDPFGAAPTTLARDDRPLADYLALAERCLAEPAGACGPCVDGLDAEAEALRWFHVPEVEAG
jgi:selenocysteine lyase/cysteine desulfurase